MRRARAPLVTCGVVKAEGRIWVMVARRDENWNWVKLPHHVKECRRCLEAYRLVIPNVAGAEHRLDILADGDLHNALKRHDEVATNPRALTLRQAQFRSSETALKMQIAELQEPQRRHRA